MNSSKIIIACACCAIAGAAAGFVLGRWGNDEGIHGAVESASARRTGGEKPDGGERVRRELHDEQYPDIAGLKTVAEWRAYLGRWIAAACPDKNLGCARECLRRWAERDADAALAFVGAAPRFSQRNSAYAIPLGIMGRAEMPRVIDWMRRNLREEDRNAVGEIVIGDIMRQYPRQAMELAVADGIPVSGYYFGQIMEAMAGVSITDAQQMFAGLPENEKAAAANGFAAALARNDPKGAVEWCMRQKDEPYGRDAIEAVVRMIARTSPADLPAIIDRHGAQLSDDAVRSAMYFATGQDPVVALEVLQKLPAEQRQRYGHDIVDSLFATDADQAVAAARVLLPAGEQFEQIYRGFERWAYSDRKAAEAWLDSETDAVLREQIKTKQLAASDPKGFLAGVSGGVAGDSFTARRIDEALRAYGEENMPEAVGWLLANSGQITEQRLRRLAQMSGDGVPITLPDIGAMSDDKARQATINFMADQWVNGGNWDNAEGLVPLVADAQKQDALRFRIFSAMMQQPSQQEGARQWLAAQPLSAEVRASWEAVAAGNARGGDEAAGPRRYPVYLQQ